MKKSKELPNTNACYKHEHNTVQFQNILKKTGHILKVKNQNSIKLNSNTETGRIMEQSLQYSEGNLNNKMVMITPRIKEISMSAC